MNLNGQHITVLGLGISGLEAAKLALRLGARVTVRDQGRSAVLETRAGELTQKGAVVELAAEAARSESDLVVLSPGIDARSAFVRAYDGMKILGEFEFAAQCCRCPVVAITGTNGKTTTTELIHRVLETAGHRTRAAGNIGTAFSAAVADSDQLDTLVLEASSYQLETVETFRPHVAVYLNLTPDHLDRYASLEDYRRAKWNIFRNQTAEDFAVVNAAESLPEMRSRRVTFDAHGRPADYEFVNGWMRYRGTDVLAASETKLIGRHNVENMLATLAVADCLEVPRETTTRVLRDYAPAPHRCEKIAVINGVTYVNDSKGTNPDAVEKALQAVQGPVVLIAGGKDKGLDFTLLRPVLSARAKAAVLIGETAPTIADAWDGAVPLHRAATLDEAVETASRLASAGDTVLLSPGCSSFDMFRDYADRGNQFRQIVLTKIQTQTQEKQ